MDNEQRHLKISNYRKQSFRIFRFQVSPKIGAQAYGDGTKKRIQA